MLVSREVFFVTVLDLEVSNVIESTVDWLFRIGESMRIPLKVPPYLCTYVHNVYIVYIFIRLAKYHLPRSGSMKN